ncbi:MAG: OmpA family protein [Planctomycetes bacterium]|nr:OmpA family protein [Planctomycetota bacterium]
MSDPIASALHPEQRTYEAHAGPTSGAERATIRAAILPFACWRVDDVRFEHDSSIVRPDVAPSLAALAALLEQNRVGDRRPTLAVFGHADSTGSDAYNKTLSGRRAQAIYALLARRVDLWEALYTRPHGGDDWAADRAVPLYLGLLGYGADVGERRRFQADRGLAVDGIIGPRSRAALFGAAMDAMCPVVIPPEGFLGRGLDPQGKADYQGCGELNLALVLSQAEEAALASKPKERAAQHAPNRRVMVFLFRPGTHVDPARWPCPRAGEGGAACAKRRWSDGEARRAPGPARRRFAETQDTFACRFYHRLADRSPCEGVLPALRLRLYGEDGRFVPHAPYRVVVAGVVRAGQTDARGVLVERFSTLPPDCTVEWGDAGGPAPPAVGPPLAHSASIHLDIDPLDDTDERAAQRLRNLGYKRGATLSDDVLSFQHDQQAAYGLQLTGLLDPPTRAALRDLHGRCPDALVTA